MADYQLTWTFVKLKMTDTFTLKEALETLSVRVNCQIDLVLNKIVDIQELPENVKADLRAYRTSLELTKQKVQKATDSLLDKPTIAALLAGTEQPTKPDLAKEMLDLRAEVALLTNLLQNRMPGSSTDGA